MNTHPHTPGPLRKITQQDAELIAIASRLRQFSCGKYDTKTGFSEVIYHTMNGDLLVVIEKFGAEPRVSLALAALAKAKGGAK